MPYPTKLVSANNRERLPIFPDAKEQEEYKQNTSLLIKNLVQRQCAIRIFCTAHALSALMSSLYCSKMLFLSLNFDLFVVHSYGDVPGRKK